MAAFFSPPSLLIEIAKEVAAHRAKHQQGQRPGCGMVGGWSHPDTTFQPSICELGYDCPGPAFCGHVV